MPPDDVRKPGVWFVYGWDAQVYPVAMFADAQALAEWLETNSGCGHQIKWWPFGEEWSNR